MLSFNKLLYLSVLKVFFFAVVFPSYAIESSWQESPEKEGKIRIIASSYDNSGIVEAGFQVKLTKNWKTYWLQSGDSGMPPSFDFSKSKNIKNFEVLFPVPNRYSYYGIESFAYAKEVVLPIKIEVNELSKPVEIDSNIKWAICDEICIFEEANLSLKINPGYKNAANSNIISTYKEKVPNKLEESTIIIQDITLQEDNIILKLSSKEDFSEEIDVFTSEKSENFRFPKPYKEFSNNRKNVTFVIPYEKKLSSAILKGEEVSFYISNGADSAMFTKIFDEVESNSVEFKNLIKKEPREGKGDFLKQIQGNESKNKNNKEDDLNITFLEAIIGAIIGGLILNIMPCVLPVLSLKLMGAIKSSGKTKSQIRKSFFFTTLGIISSFILLALITIMLKSLGEQVGWGVQFQQPAFLILLAVVLTLFAINQFGFFEVILPQSISDKLNKKLDGQDDVNSSGSFLTGAFATLMATPCTAPFLATAISFALSSSVSMILVVFFFMGVGMALPYILVIATPKAISFLPKPGPWMSKFKKLMGILLTLTVLWILTIFNANAGLMPAVVLLTCIVTIYGFMWFSKVKNLSKSRTLASIIYLTVIAFAFPLYLSSSFKGSSEIQKMWIPYTQESLEKLIEQEKTIFVDVTAEWCMTCQFNKYRVTNKLENFFKEREVILVKADFTSHNQEIADFLEKYKAYAIPFNVVYGPKNKEGIILPTVLTKSSVLDAVNKSQGLN